MDARSEIISLIDDEQMQETEKFLNKFNPLLTSQSMNEAAN